MLYNNANSFEKKNSVNLYNLIFRRLHSEQCRLKGTNNVNIICICITYGRLYIVLMANIIQQTYNYYTMPEGIGSVSCDLSKGGVLVALSFRVPAIPAHHLHAKIQKLSSVNRTIFYSFAAHIRL